MSKCAAIEPAPTRFYAPSGLFSASELSQIGAEWGSPNWERMAVKLTIQKFLGLKEHLKVFSMLSHLVDFRWTNRGFHGAISISAISCHRYYYISLSGLIRGSLSSRRDLVILSSKALPGVVRRIYHIARGQLPLSSRIWATLQNLLGQWQT